MFRLGVSKLDASIRTLSFIQIQNRFKNQALPIPKYLQNQVKMYSSAEDCMKNNSFVFKQSFVNGEWLDSVRNETFSVLNPSSGKELIQVTDCSEEDVAKAIAEAYSTFKSWRLTSAKQRSAILRKWASLMKENSEDLAAIITMEQGKPINEARGEIGYASGFLEFFADAVRLIQGEIISSPDPKKKIFVEKEPCGVAALITPWNFPTAMITRKAGAALAAGCTVVIKPAPDTPLSALALCELAEKAGVPKGVFNVLPTSLKNTPAVGKLLCSSPLVAKVSFTGSTAVGKLLLRQSADSVKKISLELGGNAPFIVFESANIDTAVEQAVLSKFRGTGQTCVCANRLFVHKSVQEEFVTKFAAAVETKMGQHVGDGFTETTTQGPLINKHAIEKVCMHVNDAVEKGAKLIIGGKARSDLGENFYQPTVISDVPKNALCLREETFGPVAPIIPFETEEEVLTMANASRSGLAGYFFSRDISQIFRVARNMEVGMVGVNSGLISTVEAPFGGIKESGLGIEGSTRGIDEYMNVKYVCIGDI